jgi:alkanesulfonate monooxygenase SsuD/methylene tetrahydromethanopterin reductase-like flavin-dependent oxidoreductase (luciferase family)
MKLGYSPGGFFPPSVPPAEAVERVLELVSTASAAGYDYVEKGDHHFAAEGQYLQNVPMAGRLAAEFDHVAAMWLLPMHDPLLVAEHAGTLDAICDTFDFWCALGYADESFEAFGVPKRERAPRFEEELELLDVLWSEDDVTYEGEFYRAEGLSVNPKADARICIGGSAEPAVRRAGRLGDAWVASSSHHGPLAEQIDWFEDAGGGDVIVRQDALALPDGDEARERARTLLADGYRSWDEDADYFSGDAADVAAQLADLEALGVDEVVIRPMDRELGTEVIETVGAARELL